MIIYTQSKTAEIYKTKAQIIFVLLFSCLFLLSLVLTEGRFIYSLDDPYIHLALAENILRGHYGVNLTEYSSASSSILWPFLLAPLQAFDTYAVMPLLINFVCALLTFKLILHWLFIWFEKPQHAYITSIIILFGANILGVAFTGMEHSLQILLALAALHGMLLLEIDKPLPHWLLMVLITGPLVRYENAILSLVVGLYAMYRGYWRSIIVSGAVTLIIMLGYSLYLKSLGLSYLSASINMKSLPLSRGFDFITVSAHFIRNSYTPGAQTFLIISILLLRAACQKTRDNQERVIAGLLFFAAILQFFGGRFGWLGRYEIYLYLPCLIYTVKLYLPKMTALLTTPIQHKKTWLLLCVCILPYASILPVTPFSARDVYHQQFQMHRFINEFHQAPVAVNDLGLVSFQNDHYVLDLWGLASQEAQALRQNMDTNEDTNWMKTLTDRHNVDLAMIYNSNRWFSQVPNTWTKIGRLKLVNKPIMLRRTVSFYATNQAAITSISNNIRRFQKTLPKGTTFEFIKEKI